MVETLFLKLLNISITASWLVLAVMIFRMVFRKAPKALRVVVWALVGIRLICPFSFESVWSLVPSAQTIPENIGYMQAPVIHSGVAILNSAVNPILQESFAPKPWESANPLQIVSFIASNLWVLGIVVMILYAGISYWKLQRKVKEAIPVQNPIYLCEGLASPFILGIWKPRIYLPANLSEEEKTYVIAHENAHLARRDHWWKPLGFLLLTIYWFNPVLWIAYILLCRDIELACDEKVIQELGMASKKPYSTALLSCSASRKSVAACPLAFGEVNVKNRIQSVLHYKKPAFWLMLLAVVIAGAIAVGFLTDPITTKIDNIVEEKGFEIVNQDKYSFPATIPVDILTEAAFTSEGQTFKKDEIIVFATETTNMYLEEVMLSHESDEFVYMLFNFSYHDLDKNSSVILPYEKSEKGYTGVFDLESEAVTDGAYWYDHAVSLRGTGPSEMVAIYAKVDMLRQAEDEIVVQFVASKLQYQKSSGFSIGQNVSVDESLKVFLNKCVVEHCESEYSEGNYRFVDVEILDAVVNENETTVYAWALYEEYSYDNGEILSESGAHFPVAISVEKVSDYYELIEFWQPEDGNRYAASIKEKFPHKLHAKAIDSGRYIEKQMEKCEEAVNAFFATNISGKIYRGEEVAYGHRVVDSFLYFEDNMPTFVLRKEDLHLLTNEYPKPSPLSSYYDIGQIQSFDLTRSNFEFLLDDKFHPWAEGYSAGKLREENKNAYLVKEEGQEYNRFYYLLEQENGDVYVAYGWEGQNIRYIFKMKERL